MRAARGIANGDRVRVFNDRGSCTLLARSGRHGSAGRGAGALGPLEQACAGPSQRQRAHLRSADRHRRRPNVLQLPGGSGEVRRLSRQSAHLNIANRGDLCLHPDAGLLVGRQQAQAPQTVPAKTQLLASTHLRGRSERRQPFCEGFYGVEENAWRWTGKEFAVDLSPPLHSDQKGAQLVTAAGGSRPVIQKLTSVQLSASIQGFKLEPQIFTKSGQYTYTRDVPADKSARAMWCASILRWITLCRRRRATNGNWGSS